MRRGFVFAVIAVAFLGCGAAFADSTMDKYNRANKLYASGDYAGALALYDELSVANPDLEYNRGCAYFKLGKIGQAVVHFNRALRYNPGDEDTLFNLDYINSIKQDREKIERPSAMISRMMSFISLSTMSWISIFLYLGASLAGLMVISATDEAKKNRYVKILSALAVLTILSGSVTGFRIYEFERSDRAIAVEPTIDAFSAPTEASDKVFTFHEGTQVSITRVAGQFALVTLSSGLSGWAPLDKLERV